MDNRPIAFFDSGIGGLTVLHKARKKWPQESYIYFADSAHLPYGKKSKKEIKKLVHSAVDYLVQKDIKALVLACNTATSAAVKSLRKKYDFPIIGIEPAVKPATEINRNKKVMVCATKLTLKQDKLSDLISNLNANDKVTLVSLQKLVKYAERFDFESPQVDKYLRNKFADVKWKKYSSIVLGCTHFIYFKQHIKRVVPSHIQIIDGNEGTVNRMMDIVTPAQKGHQKINKFLNSTVIGHPKYYQKYMSYLDIIEWNQG